MDSYTLFVRHSESASSESAVLSFTIRSSRASNSCPCYSLKKKKSKIHRDENTFMHNSKMPLYGENRPRMTCYRYRVSCLGADRTNSGRAGTGWSLGQVIAAKLEITENVYKWYDEINDKSTSMYKVTTSNDSSSSFSILSSASNTCKSNGRAP